MSDFSEISYMDNAATTWPKPSSVSAAMVDAMNHFGGNPGRGGHRMAIAAGELLYEARCTVTEFLGGKDPFRLAFAQNITMAINLVLQGMLRPGDHVLVSPMEHNAVMRTLHQLSKKGVLYDVLPSNPDGMVHPEAIEAMIRPETKLICICHESNVTGIIQPIRAIGTAVKKTDALLLVDCAQSAGSVPLGLNADFIDFLTFTGHKGLLGPMGTGGVLFGDRVNIETINPLIFGGTGSVSDKYTQPDFMPDRFESGTQNVVGLAGLIAGIKWLKERGTENLRFDTDRRMRWLIDGLRSIHGVNVYGAANPEYQGVTVSVTIDGVDNGTAGARLDQEFGVLSRIGLHCSPAAHRTIGTFPNGTIRFSISPLTGDREIACTLKAVEHIASDPL